MFANDVLNIALYQNVLDLEGIWFMLILACSKELYNSMVAYFPHGVKLILASFLFIQPGQVIVIYPFSNLIHIPG